MSLAYRDNKTALFAQSSIWTFALALFFTINMNYDWRTGYLAWYGTLAVVMISFLIAFNGKIILKNLSFEIWMGAFIALGIVSLLWSLSTSVAMDVIKNLIVYLVVLFLIHSSLNLGFEVDTILKCYFVAIIINVIYIVSTIDLTALGDTQLGSELLEGWNGNGIGFMTAQGLLIGYHLSQKSKKIFEKTLFWICVIALAFLTIYTGSRTAFIMLVAQLAIYFWLKNPTKKIRNIFIIALVIIVTFYLVMNVKSFYNVLGSRLEGLFALFSGEGEVDSSADMRDTFIENGKKWFAQQPMIGYGINNYKMLNRGATGRFTYAHNTFIELAVDLGIVGLILYYSVYVYLIFRLLRSTRNNHTNIFLFTALVVSLLSHYGTVCYYGFYQNLLLFLCFWAVNKHKRKSSV